MRLLYLSADPGVPVLGHKGASVHLREVVRALVAEGPSVVVASPRIEPEGDALDAPVDLVAVDPVLPDSAATAAALRVAIDRQAEQVTELARRLDVDAVYERYSLFSNAGVRAAELLSLPHALEVNAPLRAEARRFRSLPYGEVASEIEAQVYAATHRIFVVSKRLGQLVSANGVEQAKVELAPNAVAADRFPRHRPRGNRPFTVGFAGGLKAWHGVDLLLTAFGAAVQEGADMRLEIVGVGPLDAVLDDAELPEGRLIRHGALAHAATIRRMSSWDVGAAPFLPVSDFYFSPLKILEYMAARVCPVASDLGEIGSLLGGGQRGVLVPPGDVDALAEALVALAREPERARRLGTRARAFVRTNGGWERNARRVLSALQGAPRAVAA